MGNGASNPPKDKSKPQVADYPVQPPARPPVQPPSYNEPLHVPVSFYPNNVYSPSSSGGGTFSQINREIDNFDYRLTEAIDGNRYFNAVRDPSIPPAPGTITAMTFVPTAPPPQMPPVTQYHNPQPSVPPAYSTVYPEKK